MKPSITFINEDTMSIQFQLQISINDLINAQEAPARERLGRPRALSFEDERLFLVLMKAGASSDHICAALSISKSTYFRVKRSLKSSEAMG